FWRELNTYRELVGSKPLTLKTTLCISAKTRAEKMAKHHQLMPDNENEYEELIIFAPHGYGIYSLKILFDDAFFNNFRGNSINKRSDFTRLLAKNLQIVGIGMVRSGYGVYICIKFSSSFW
uniref:SCP domain-containing protein n=1 Tax=Strongyloides papillosus TaxID=174720 RepID=A0A0N5BJI8_STREA